MVVFSFFPGFGLTTVLNALGGENGSPVDAEIPATKLVGRIGESHQVTMGILHMVASGELISRLKQNEGGKHSIGPLAFDIMHELG